VGNLGSRPYGERSSGNGVAECNDLETTPRCAAALTLVGQVRKMEMVLQVVTRRACGHGKHVPLRSTGAKKMALYQYDVFTRLRRGIIVFWNGSCSTSFRLRVHPRVDPLV